MTLREPKLVNEIQTVTTSDAKAMARRLAKEEGIFAGTSSGANVVAAIRIARLGPGATIVTILCDSDLRYLSTTSIGGSKRRESRRPTITVATALVRQCKFQKAGLRI